MPTQLSGGQFGGGGEALSMKEPVAYPDHAEAQAVFLGLKLALRLQAVNVIVESNSQFVVKRALDPSKKRTWRHKYMYWNISNYFEKFLGCNLAQTYSITGKATQFPTPYRLYQTAVVWLVAFSGVTLLMVNEKKKKRRKRKKPTAGEMVLVWSLRGRGWGFKSPGGSNRLKCLKYIKKNSSSPNTGQ